MKPVNGICMFGEIRMPRHVVIGVEIIIGIKIHPLNILGGAIHPVAVF